jgi:hypothetical protein
MAGQHSQYRLLAQRRFRPFFVVQLLGAFNGNLFKNFLVLLVTYQVAEYTRLDSNVLTNAATSHGHETVNAILLAMALLEVGASFVAKRLDAPYRAGRQLAWRNVKYAGSSWREALRFRRRRSPSACSLGIQVFSYVLTGTCLLTPPFNLLHAST